MGLVQNAEFWWQTILSSMVMPQKQLVPHSAAWEQVLSVLAGQVLRMKHVSFRQRVPFGQQPIGSGQRRFLRQCAAAADASPV
jgi:hypothetical protein